MISIVVYVPESHLEEVKQAMFNAGAGRIGNYDSCSWQTKGKGQYRPLPGSTPYQGEEGRIEKAEEWKIELVCASHLLAGVIEAMKKAHPYETPAYHAIPTINPQI